MSNSEVTSAELAEINKIIVQIVTQALMDNDFMRRFTEDPVRVFAENGITFPADKDVKIHQDTEKTYHFVLPMKPRDLSDDDIESYVSMQNESGGNDAIQGGARCTKP